MEKLLKKIIGTQFEDVISIGFNDEENGIIQYVIDMHKVYLDFENIRLSFECINNYSKLLIKGEGEIQFDYTIDEDMKYGFSKLHNVIFSQGEAVDVFLEKIYLYNVKKSFTEYIVCDAIKILLSTGQILFFDPSYYFGINIGDEKIEKIWKQQNKRYTCIEIGETEKII